MKWRITYSGALALATQLFSLLVRRIVIIVFSSIFAEDIIEYLNLFFNLY